MRSSCEAELYAFAEAVSESIWLRRLLHDVGFPQAAPTIINQDNQSAIEIVKTNKYHNRIRHISNNYFFARQRYLSKEILPSYCATENMPADIFTKALTVPIFNQHVKFIGIQSAKPFAIQHASTCKRDIELSGECET
jgi:hypothetical protein